MAFSSTRRSSIHNKSTERNWVKRRIGRALVQIVGDQPELFVVIRRWMWMRVSSCEPFNQWANNSLSGLCS